MTHGGYREPANPAQVSGPGKYSKRTDGGVAAQVQSAAPGQSYGDAGAQLDAQRIAPMAGTAPTPNTAIPPQGGGGPPAGGSLTDPSARAGEPITSGTPLGAGPGTEALSFTQPPQQAVGSGTLTNMLQQLSATDTTGILGQLYLAARNHNA